MAESAGWMDEDRDVLVILHRLAPELDEDLATP